MLFVVLALLSLTPWASAPEALVGGIVFALGFNQPPPAFARRWTTPLLQAAVVGLGAGMDLGVITKVGVRGVGYTAVGIAVTLLITRVLATLLRTDPTISLLVGVGTAICGGSAIAAVAPVIRAKSSQTSVALAVVFCLNAIALIIFPQIGHAAGLSPRLFGLWSAVAIHDTSSVVGAALTFGPQATEVATTVKLARTLWIIPLALGAAALPIAHRTTDGPKAKPKWPWFIVGFVLAAAAATYVPGLRTPGALVAIGARHLLVLTLFLVGSALSRSALREVGWRPLALGLLVWVAVGCGSLAAIHAGWLKV
jgi:uncharacterized integral membrane protein (TIGR00698 family)